MNFLSRYNLILVLLLVASITFASPTTEETTNVAPMSMFDVLQTESIQELMIETDIDKLITNNKKEKYQLARFTYTDDIGRLSSKMIKVKPRGKSRRRVCDFPPVMLKFKKEELQFDGLDTTANTLKLVTHCLNSDVGEEQLLKEYLIYKMYNQLTPNSYNVQLVKIAYKDTKDKHSTITRYGFILENNDEMANRLGGMVEDRYGVFFNDLSASNAHTFALFQYMIGNTDWSLFQNHNLKIVIPKNSTDHIISVPYDFDMTGLVDATYAKANPDFPLQSSVRERIYLGPCTNANDLRETVELFKAKESQIKNMINDFDLLSEKSRKVVSNYIKGFYKELSNDKKMMRKFAKHCRS